MLRPQGNNLPVLNGEVSGLTPQPRPIQVSAIFLKRYDGLYRLTLSGSGLKEVTDQGTQPQPLYNRVVEEFKAENSGKNLIIPPFNQIPIQS